MTRYVTIESGLLNGTCAYFALKLHCVASGPVKENGKKINDLSRNIEISLIEWET